jgi:hypothetical protein
MKTEQAKQTKPLLLWWYDKNTNKNLPAGVAFYDEKFAEYRLKLDIHPDTQYYLKPTGSQSEDVLYRAEVVIKKDGKFHQRKVIGEEFLTGAPVSEPVIIRLVDVQAPYFPV